MLGLTMLRVFGQQVLRPFAWDLRNNNCQKSFNFKRKFSLRSKCRKVFRKLRITNLNLLSLIS